MWASYFAQHPLVLLPILAMALFMTVFAAITVRAWRRSSLPLHDNLSRLPLNTSEEHHHTETHHD